MQKDLIDVINTSPWIQKYGHISKSISGHDLFNFLWGLHTAEIAYLYKILWDGSQKKFCGLYKINSGNFSRWLNGKKHSNASHNAVINFIIDNNSLYFSSIKSYNDKSTSNMIYYSVSTAYERIKRLVESISYIIIIDGDHISKTLDQLSYIEPSDEYSSQWNIHVVVGITDGVYPSFIQKYKERPWLTVVSSYNTCKNAVDTSLIFLSAYLSILSETLHFIIVSRDGFIEELRSALLDRGNLVDIVPPWIHLGFWFLSTYEVDQFVPKDDKQKLSSLTHVKSVFDKAYSKIENMDLKPKTIKQFIDIFENIISSKNIADMDISQAPLVFACKYKWPKNEISVDISTMSEEDLRVEIRIALLKLTLKEFREFCKKYNVKEKSFTSWLNKNTRSDKTISDVIRKWIQELRINQEI